MCDDVQVIDLLLAARCLCQPGGRGGERLLRLTITVLIVHEWRTATERDTRLNKVLLGGVRARQPSLGDEVSAALNRQSFGGEPSANIRIYFCGSQGMVSNPKEATP